MATTEKTEKQKRITLITMEQFNPADRDMIQTFPVDEAHAISFRVVPVSELVLKGVSDTRDVFVRHMRETFMGEYDRGERRLPLMEQYNELMAQYTMHSGKELRANWERVYAKAKPTTEEDHAGEEVAALQRPEGIDAWTDEDYRKDLVRLQMIETLVEAERAAIRRYTAQLVMDIGEATQARDLNMQEYAERITQSVDVELNERRLILRELDYAAIEKRLVYAACMDLAAMHVENRVLVVALYLVARQVDDRTKVYFDLSNKGIASGIDALKDPLKTYDAMLELFRKDEDFLFHIARSITAPAGMVTDEMRQRLTEAAQEPFRTESGGPREEAGQGPRMGVLSVDGDSGPGDAPSEAG